ncbi:hypothetical protein NBRC110019_26530 [Neptunitalea chrysea]|uniref:DUF4834 domain-containing protein n=1 Tax=Neptunitalea chrysea TaxID=1647581 RepID=A0A9W6B820_9FLAO|nr:DUF4834 family protein [Neptunitalea chrysea]GLB53612.1 hypothetical protein NBRC110019_26530 [Neptunitalea chrysea]
MQEAYLAGFLRTIFIIFAIIIVIRYVTKVFMPYILRYLVKKSEDHINRKFNEHNQQSSYNQSSSNAHTTPHNKPTEKKKVGEYIDFEEID